ncbi:signal peptidase I [Flavobacterium sp.]|uniref:signal peptidase I n=1 Tax=Flavobacterium sp. TaxID=239 RepID=UPI00262E6E89|nr:signal peptidase I [Flavobacterium sp.]
MTLTQWFIFFLIVQVIHFLGTFKLYEKAGRKPWEAAVPVYNAVVLMQIIGRPRWWVILLFIPIVNLIMFPVVWVETLRSFGKTSVTDTILGVVTLGLYIYYINYSGQADYRPERELKPESKSGDTVSSLLFAVVVATIVHTYVMQPFTIPTSSLEKTLLVGDFLFVSKFHYGARTPMTTVALPMIHDSIPLTQSKSYSKWPQLPYFRLPGFEDVEKNDIVVFNWPIDSIGFRNAKAGVHNKPIDKKSNYVKRCVGTPGDSLSIKNGVVYINGKELKLSGRARPQYNYPVVTNGPVTNLLLEQYDITEFQVFYMIQPELWDNADFRAFVNDDKKFKGSFTEFSRDSTGVVIFGNFQADKDAQHMALAQKLQPVPDMLMANLTEEKAVMMKTDSSIKEVKDHFVYPGSPEIFPYTENWSVDNMGPIYIPEAGKTVALNSKSLPFYKEIITKYEGHELNTNGNTITIDGKPANSYTFTYNYYWMMGDNRHNSEDSRFWGYVPETHIVGKPVFVWMSLDENEPWSNFGKKVRWDRLFTTVGGDDEPTSYFKYFIILLVAYFVWDYVRKGKKKAAQD